jgi:hypothetical protein
MVPKFSRNFSPPSYFILATRHAEYLQSVAINCKITIFIVTDYLATQGNFFGMPKGERRSSSFATLSLVAIIFDLIKAEFLLSTWNIIIQSSPWRCC